MDLADRCTEGVVFFRSIHSQSILVEARCALPATGPVACGSLWAKTAVVSSSSAVIHEAHI